MKVTERPAPDLSNVSVGAKPTEAPTTRRFGNVAITMPPGVATDSVQAKALDALMGRLGEPLARLEAPRPYLLPIEKWLDETKLGHALADAATKPESLQKLAEALEAYTSDNFAFQPVENKRSIIETLGSIATQKGQLSLARLHLPRESAVGNCEGYINYALEYENNDPRIVRYYEPKEKPEGWDALGEPEQMAWLAERIGQRPDMVLRAGAPEHFEEDLTWENTHIYEIITASRYDCLDQLFLAIDQAAEVTHGFGGPHIHVTVTPRTRESIAEHAEGLTAVAHTLNMGMFARDMDRQGRAFSQPNLSVMSGHKLEQLTRFFAGGHWPSNTKLYKLGVRARQLPYPDRRTIGYEIRGPFRDDNNREETLGRYRQMASIAADALATGDFSVFALKPELALPEDLNAAARSISEHPLLDPDQVATPRAWHMLIKNLRNPIDENNEWLDSFDQRLAAPLLPWHETPFAVNMNPDVINDARDEFLGGLGKLLVSARKQKQKTDMAHLGRTVNELLVDWATTLCRGGLRAGVDAHLDNISRALAP